MDASAKTIQIFLPEGQPRGIRIAEITTRIVKAILIPRTRLAAADARDELRSVGVYFLFGESETAGRPLVYVGEAEDCLARLKQHNAAKDFWSVAIAVVSKTQNFTKAHAKYLEWHSIKECKRAARYDLDNSSLPSEPFVTEIMLADLMDAFETIDVLLSTLGYPIFQRSRDTVSKASVFICTCKSARAKGKLTEDGFVVLEGSTVNAESLPSAHFSIDNRREELLGRGVLDEKGGLLVFTKDHLMDSPSGAASLVRGGNANGWTEWKDSRGRTLDQVYRGDQAKPSA